MLFLLPGFNTRRTTLESSPRSSQDIFSKMISRLDRNVLVVGLVLAMIGVVVQHVQCANYSVGAGFVESGNGYYWTNIVDGLLKPSILENAYANWSSSVKVASGDKLTFEYPLGSHTVFMAKNDIAYLNCDFTGAVQVPDGFPTTYTVKSTDTALYFVCNIPGHCLQGGQKVKVTPMGTSALAPPALSNAPHQSAVNSFTITAFLLSMSSAYLTSTRIL